MITVRSRTFAVHATALTRSVHNGGQPHGPVAHADQ